MNLIKFDGDVLNRHDAVLFPEFGASYYCFMFRFDETNWHGDMFHPHIFSDSFRTSEYITHTMSGVNHYLIVHDDHSERLHDFDQEYSHLTYLMEESGIESEHHSIQSLCLDFGPSHRRWEIKSINNGSERITVYYQFYDELDGIKFKLMV
jgi:hypothetical protein